jgi:sugar phosphate permease
MPAPGGNIESQSAPWRRSLKERPRVHYVEIIAAVAGALMLAWIADLLTGRRGLAATLLVSGVGAACGAFLAIRVFAVATLAQWPWVGWAMGGSIFCLAAYFLFRSKR